MEVPCSLTEKARPYEGMFPQARQDEIIFCIPGGKCWLLQREQKENWHLIII